MSDQERVTLTLTRREVELTAAAIDLMADLMAGGDRERELRPLFATIIRQAREQINEQ